MKTRFKAIPCSHLILKDKNKILLYSRLKDEENLCYNLVAGHVEQEESPISCMIREAKEEIGIDINRRDIKLVHTMYKPIKHNERIEFFCLCEKWSGEIQNLEPHKCMGVEFFEINNLPETLVGYSRLAIENIFKGVHFSEYFDTDGMMSQR